MVQVHLHSNGAASRRGFTLIEVVVVLAFLGTIIGMTMPTLAGLIRTDKEQATQAQVEQVWRAIFGDPAKGEFGYFGDMGRLPSTLAELIDQGGQVAFHTSGTVLDAMLPGATHQGNIGTGWRGPYLRDFFSTTDLLSDAWGRPLTLNNARVVSDGPDGLATTADDIIFPVSAPMTTGTAFVTVLVNRIPSPLGTTTKLYSPVNGEQTATTTKKYLPADSTFDGFYYEDLKPGLHVLRLANTSADGTGQCITVTRIVTTAVHAGRQVVSETRMVSPATVKVAENLCTIPD